MHRRRLYIYSGTAQPDLIAQAARNSTADLIYAVPFVFKMLSEHEAGLEALRNAGICCYSGAPCPIEVGDMLVAKGVNLIAFLGSTEFGQAMVQSFHPTRRIRLLSWWLLTINQSDALLCWFLTIAGQSPRFQDGQRLERDAT